MSQENAARILASQATRLRRLRPKYTEDEFGVACTINNLAIALIHEPEWVGVIAYDELRDQCVMRREPPWPQDLRGSEPPVVQLSEGYARTRQWADEDDARLASWWERKHGRAFPIGNVPDAVRLAAKRNSFSPVCDLLNSYEWDGEPRLDTWLIDHAGAEDKPIVRAFGSKFLLSAVARAFEPGCKADHVLVLESPQGFRKTTAVRHLALGFYKRAPKNFKNKDELAKLRGGWICEFEEMGALGTSRQDDIKSFVDATSDEYRRPYGRHNVEYARRSVFIATTNRYDWAKDPTGNRRFWPVRVQPIAISQLVFNLDQIWAEAVHRYRQGEPWWLQEQELIAAAEAEQEQRFDAHAWEDLLRGYCAGRSYVSYDDLLGKALRLREEKWEPNKGQVREIMMHRLGWAPARRKQSRGFRPGNRVTGVTEG